MRRDKKASMQLSINAIVILVMAMAVLGIGLGLIRGVLAPAQGNLEDALGKVDLSEVATSTKTIANIPRTLRMKATSENEIAVSFYNTGLTNCEKNSAVRLNCGGTVVTKYDSILSIPSPQGMSTTLLAIVIPSSLADSPAVNEGAVGSRACKIEIICSKSLIKVDNLASGAVDSPIPTALVENSPSGNGPYIADSIATFVNFG